MTQQKKTTTDNPESFAQKAAAKAHSVVDKAANATESLEASLRTQAAKAGEAVESGKETATDALQTSFDKLETFVKERPIAAAGIAFAAGVLATSIMRR